jgi:hypothetical protein
LHNALVSGEPLGEVEVTSRADGPPVVDTMERREVALDVELVVKYPVNLATPLV